MGHAWAQEGRCCRNRVTIVYQLDMLLSVDYTDIGWGVAMATAGTPTSCRQDMAA